MRFTIIRSDNVVIVNGEAYRVDLSNLSNKIHAIQWFGETGEIEWIDPLTGKLIQNELITDYLQYEWILQNWEIAKQQYLDSVAEVKIIEE